MQNSPDPKESLYKGILMQHYRERKNRHELSGNAIVAWPESRACGDRIKLHVRFAAFGTDTIIEDCSYTGEGCSISVASANMACEVLRGAELSTARSHVTQVHAFLDKLEKSQLARAPSEIYADLSSLESLSRFATRVACARLAWSAASGLLGILPA